MKVIYLNRPDKSDPENKLRVLSFLVFGKEFKFTWRALWDNKRRLRYVGFIGGKDVYEEYTIL